MAVYIILVSENEGKVLEYSIYPIKIKLNSKNTIDYGQFSLYILGRFIHFKINYIGKSENLSFEAELYSKIWML